MKKILGISSYLLLSLCSFAQNNLDLLSLNGGSTAQLAFSVRKLSSDYNGPVMQIRRTTDLAEGLLYFDGNDITSNSVVILQPGITVATSLGNNAVGNISTGESKTGSITVRTSKSGVIRTNVGNTSVSGTGTSFLTELAPGDVLYTTGNAFIGVVKSIGSNTSLTLRNGAMMANTRVNFQTRNAPATGTGTAFTSELQVGDRLFNNSNAYLGTVLQIIDDNDLIVDALTAVAASNVSFKSTGVTVTGSGTDFTQLQVGKMLISNNITIGLIASIESATSLTLSTKAGAVVSSQAFKTTDGSMSFSSFYNAASVFVRTWYDQSGYGRNLTQVKETTGLPRLVNAGVPDVKNGRQTVLFDRALQMYLWTDRPADYLANTLYTVNNVTSETIMPGSQYSFVMSTTGHTGPINSVHHYGYRSYSVFTVAQYSNDQDFTVTPSTNLEVHTAVKTLIDRSKLIVNNNTIDTKVSGAGAHMRDLGLYSIGYYGPTGTYFHGTVSEAVLYATALPDNERQSMDENQMAYYMISAANWTGAVDTDWFKTGNWASGVVPNLTNNLTAVIPAGLTNYPNITGTTAEVLNLNIATGATCTITGTLKLGGTITNNGTCNATAGTLELVAASPQLISGATFASSTLGGLVINTTNNAQVTLAGSLTVANTLSFQSNGKLSLSNYTLTLQGSVVNTVAGRLTGSTNATIEVTGNASPTLSFDQVVTNGNALKKLGINTTGVVSLASNLTLVNTTSAVGLAITNGKLSIGSNTLTIKNASSIINTVAGGITGGSTSNLIVEGTVNRTLSFDQTQPGVSNVLNNFSVATTGNNTTSIANDVVVNGTLNVNAGEVLDMTTASMTGTPTAITLNGLLQTQSMSATPLPANANWTGTGKVDYNGSVSTSPQTAVGGSFYNLAISNATGGAKASGNIAVSNQLSLSNNPAANRGSLEMTIDYADYATVSSRTSPDSTGLATPLNNYYNKLNSYILDLGASATTVGTGDVTGKVRRSTIVAGVEYSFGHPSNSITFSNNGTLPSSITFITKVGAAYHLIDTSVNRHYQIIRAGGTTTNTFTVKLRYLESEVHGNDIGNENKLVLWDHHIPYGGVTPHMHGKTAQSLTERWIALSGHSVTYLCDSTAYEAGTFAKYWSVNQANTTNNFTWIGAVPGASNWNVASNWNGGVVPGPDDDVIIPNASTTPHDPNLPNDITIRSLVIENGGVMNGGDKTITINGGPTQGGNTILGSWINNGTFNAGTSTVVFTNTNATIAGINQFYNLSVANGATLTPESGSTIRVNGTFANNGTFRADFNPATIEYNGTVVQPFVSPNGGTGAYYHLVLNNESVTLPAQVNVLGNITNNANTNFSNTTIVLNGVAPQVISGAVAPSFQHLQVNNATGVVLQTDATIQGTLTLSDGTLQVGTQTLTLMDDVQFSGSGAFASASTGTIVYGKLSDGQQVLPGQYGNLSFSNYVKQLPTAAPVNISGNFLPGTVPQHLTTGTTINFNGDVQTIPAFRFYNLVSSGTGNKSVSDSAFVQEVLDVRDGVELQANGLLVLQSNANGTARVARLDDEGTGAITGNVIVERYLPAYNPTVGSGRRMRLLTIPVVNDNLTIRDAWANGQSATSTFPDGAQGLGTIITGHAYDNANSAIAAGFDWFTGLDANSVSGIRKYTHNGNIGSWSSSTNTPNVTELQSSGNLQQGYLLLVRGDRSVGSNDLGSGETLLRPLGALKAGAQAIDVSTKATKGFSVVGNPYASPIDFQTIQTDNASVIQNRVWVWDARLGDNQGGFRMAAKLGGTWKTTPYRFGEENQTYSNEVRYIPSGTAFVVEPTAAGGTLTINEVHKNANGNLLVRLDAAPPEPTPTPTFMSNLLGNTAGTYSLLDGALSLFDITYVKDITDGNDIAKLENANEQLAISRRGSLLAWEARPEVDYWDTVFLNIQNLQQRDYALELFGDDLGSLAMSARLLDDFLNTETTLDLSGGVNTYPFSVTADPASYAPDRFMVVFRGPLVLPVNVLSAKAYRQQAVNIVSWKTTDETNLKQFEVERSSNGQQFEKMATVFGKGGRITNEYVCTDAMPFAGNNYYRIKIVLQNGNVQYSQVMLVMPASQTAMVQVYPLPVQNGRFNLQLAGLAEGKYQVRLINALGQPVASSVLQHKGSSAVYQIDLNNTVLPAGMYQLQVAGTNQQMYTKPILVQ